MMDAAHKDYRWGHFGIMVEVALKMVYLGSVRPLGAVARIYFAQASITGKHHGFTVVVYWRFIDFFKEVSHM